MRFWTLTIFSFACIIAGFCPTYASTTSCENTTGAPSLERDAIAKALDWVSADINRCGGYYIEEAIQYPKEIINTDKFLITSDQGVFSFHGTSVSQGKVTITRAGQEITANKAYLYRDPKTGKISAIDMEGNVRLHEPNQLVVGKFLHYDKTTASTTLNDLLYRTTIYGDTNPTPVSVSYTEQQKTRKSTQMTAWGKATSFNQNKPKVYDFTQASYSTCPPLTHVWNLKAQSIELNKNTGRGTARNARLYIKNIPVFYTPYFNFPIDARRQTGFLFPRFGSSNRFGPYLITPYYWNLAPNYDTTITPAYLSKRGLQLTNLYRYLTPTRHGQVTLSVLPNDSQFTIFKQTETNLYQSSTDPFVQADLRRLQHNSNTRKSLSWQEEGQYNKNWSSKINYNYVSDDYYLRDFNNNIDTVTDNQLLQLAEVDYDSQHWDFTTRLQSYQTLNQVDQATVPNSYSRFPQFTLGGRYPDDHLGLEYFINNDVTRYDIRNTPGDNSKLPIGVRSNIQPGVSKSITLPYFYLTPRLQFAMTKYDIGDVANYQSKIPTRALPIFDINSGLYFDRDVSLFRKPYRQTLEPQVYYTYIPYKDQSRLPIFDTTLNTLTYDQMFIYNRFSGLDRIGDANQVSLGLTTRFIDSVSGYEKVTAGIGEIYYFKKRLVTLCTDPTTCSDAQNNPNNTTLRSPLSAMLRYAVNPQWSATANSIFNTKLSRFDNESLTVAYTPEARKIINLTYNFVRDGDFLLPWEPVGSPTANLSQTDLSLAWPVTRDWSVLGRWTENWNQRRLQNVLSGLQYDSCCWAVRFVAGRSFVALRTNNTFQYNNQVYVEFSLKGLGNYGYGGDSSNLLARSISGYQSNFGRDY